MPDNILDDIEHLKMGQAAHDLHLAAIDTRLDKLETAPAPSQAPAAPPVITDTQIVQALRTLLMGSAAAPGGGATSTGGTTAPTDPFPSDPAAAKFPSPENSTSSIFQGKISGAPYLRSNQGAIWFFDLDANGAPIPLQSQYGLGHQVSVNGVPIAGTPIQMLMVRQGQVYFQADTIWSALEQLDSPVSGVAHTPPPPPWVSTGVAAGGQTVALPAMPPDPPNPTLGTGKTIMFGQGASIAAALATAASGDIVQYDPSAPRSVTFAESFSLPDGVTIDLGGRWSDLAAVAAAFAAQDWAKLDTLYTPGAVIDGATLADPTGYAHQNGAIVYLGSGMVSGARIKNFGMQEAQHGGTAGLRAYGACNGTISGKQNYITDCQNGIGPGGASISTNFSETVIIRCGLGDGAGGAHCVYDTGSVVHSVYGPNFFSNGMANPPGPQSAGSGGHALKSRGKTFKLIAPFHLQGTDSSALDRPDGSTTPDEIGAGIIEQCAGALNHNLSGYAAESETNGIAGQNYKGTTMIGNCDQPGLLANGPMAFDAACVFKGNKISVPAGAPVTGLA